MLERYSCCFCGRDVDYKEAVILEVYTSEEPEDKQGLFVHRACYVLVLHKDVPLLPSLMED